MPDVFTVFLNKDDDDDDDDWFDCRAAEPFEVNTFSKVALHSVVKPTLLTYSHVVSYLY